MAASVEVQHHEVIVAPEQPVSLDDQIATTKEEEWVKRKKVEVVTKRQIATRVQREVVLEDGKVVQDSGPKVTTTTTEDTEKKESENTEHHDIDNGDGKKEITWESSVDPAVLTEVREKKVTSREEKQETVETEDVKHLGDITDEAYRRAIGSADVQEALVRSPGLELTTVGPRIVASSSKTHRVTDTEDSLKTSGIDSSGKIVTSTTTTKEHEEVNEEEIPEEKAEGEEEFVKEKSHHFSKTKDQEFVDYLADGVKIGTEMRYNAETSQGTRLGEWDSLSERLNKMRRGRFLKESEQDRKDALTRCPLDFDQEERTRKAETSKWLEHHFGSESASRSSRESDEEPPATGYINVTMKSAKEPRQTTGKVFLSSPEPERLTYFKGISEWKSEERRAPPGRIKVLPTGPERSFSQSPSPGSGKLHERTSPSYGHSPVYSAQRVSPVHARLNGKSTPSREHTPPSVSPPPRRPLRKSQREEEEEPAPDYSPVSEPRSSPHRITPDIKRKIYQRTRFAADIPPPQPASQPPPNVKSKPEGKRGGLGQSFRRLVGKLRSTSGDRKKKGKKTGGDHEEGRVVDSGTQTPGEMHTVQRYYLGEDPFQGSIYGRESEYDGVGYRRKYRREEDTRQHSSQGSSTLGRLSKSTGRLSGNERPIQNGTTVYYTDRGGIQTLPRKLQEHKVKKEVHVTRSNGETSLPSSDRYRLGNNSSSMFNVSIVNNVSSSSPSYLNGSTGPAKPARTYRNNLLRSKSFNVHAGGDPGKDFSNRYTSNPQLHRLDESHAPLKSPGIVTSISRSTRDISEALHEEDDIVKRRPLTDQNRYAKANGYASRSNIETKKKIFMKGLMERAPELYRTLHGNETDTENSHSPEPRYTSTPIKNGRVEYNTTFRTSSPLERIQSPLSYSYSNGSSSDVNRSIIRRGSNDYTETVRYTTKSEDPLRPSVTNTVQSYTKKILPSVGGRKETIQSTETKTITKSRFRSGTPDLKYLENDNKYSSNNGGVIIEVRNTRK